MISKKLEQSPAQYSKFVGIFHHKKEVSVVVYGCTDSGIIIHEFVSSYLKREIIRIYFVITVIVMAKKLAHTNEVTRSLKRG